MSRYSYMQGNSGSLFSQYPTPENTQTNNSQSQPSQPRTPAAHQSSQSNTTQIVDSFLSDVPQGIYSELSTLDNSSAIPTILQDSSELTPHTPESLLYSPAPDSSLGDDLNSRKQLRRSPRILNSRTPQTSEQQSDSTSLRSQESSNNRELVNKNPAALALEVLNESTDLNLIQQFLSEHINREVSPSNTEEKSTLVSRNLDNNHRMEIDSENRDINELRDLITTSNMILDTVHHNSASHRNQEYTHERHKGITKENESFIPPHDASQLELEREHEHENEYPESVDLIISNEISDALLRQSEHYNDMASKFSNLKFIKVEPESEEETEQFTTTTPGIRRSTRKRTTANYSYPRYSYGGGSSKRSKTRKRSRSYRKGSLPVSEIEADVDSGVTNADSEKNEEIDEPVHELSPIQSDEEQGAMDDSGDVDKNNKSQGNLYLKHDLRSRKIMLELLETAKREETEEDPVVAVVTPSKEATGSKRPAKKSTLKEKPAKSTIKRKPSRKSISKIDDPEWHPNEEVDSDDSEVVTSPVTPTPRGRRATSKTRSASKASTTSKKTTTKNKNRDTTPEVSITKSKKASPKTPKTTRTVRKPIRGRGRGRGRSSRLKGRDDEYKYSGGEESESEIETKSNSDDIVNDNSENVIARESSDIEMDFTQEVESFSTPTRPKRTRKSATNEPITPESTRSTRSRDGSKRRSGRKSVNALDNDDERDDAVHNSSDEEQQAGLVPKKTARGTRGGTRGGRGRGGKGRSPSSRVGGNTATDQPSVPTSDPDVVEISAGNPLALANAVRALAGQNYDIVHSPENIDIDSIEEAHAPVLVKPARSTLSPEWTTDHWQNLRVLYEETKGEYIDSGKVVIGNEDIYKEVTKKFFEVDINNRIFGEEELCFRVKSLETKDNDEPSDRRSSIESKTYSNLRDNVAGTKRKRSESNATTTPEDKKEHKIEENDEIEDKVSKRPRVEESTPSGSVTIPATPAPQDDGMLSKLFGGWFRSGRSQSNPALLNEETPGESANNVGENEDIMENDEEPSNSTPTRSRSWLW